MALKIYFAGPNVFHPDAKEMELKIEEYCDSLGITALIPGDSGIDWSNADKKAIAKQIFDINVDHLNNCDAVIANVIPFRGACVDDGTAWEIGFAHALNKPVLTYGFGDELTGDVIASVSGVHPGFRNPRRDREGYLIEEFGLQNNLMIACSTKHFPLDFDPYDDIVEAIKGPVQELLNQQ